ncbi:MAG: YaaL family protein [Defluviitaleaceae bacterium]|nr:YaaL family protein [Defluviitaleaceae bacterium]
MENITQTPYAPKTWSNFAITQANPTRKQKAKKLSQEDIEIVAALEAVISDMDFLHNCFDQTTEAILVDSLIYELKALNLRYQYYLNLCKEKGIIHAGIPESRK